jgi:hypothetical protein
MKVRNSFFSIFEDNIICTKVTKVLDIGTTGAITDQDNFLSKNLNTGKI